MREIPVELQKLFIRLLLLNQQSAEVSALTNSFGWKSNEVHDCRDTWRPLSVVDIQNNITVEPLNKGYFGSGDFVLYLEAVLWWEVPITIVSTRVIPIGAVASVLYIEVVLWWESPL